MTRKKTLSELATTGLGRADRPRQPRSPDAGTVGAPPAHLEAPLAAIWSELAAAIPAGVGSAADRLALELACRLVAKSRTGVFTSSDGSQLRQLLADFGMTPGGRTRMDLPTRVSAPPSKIGARFFRG